ncbi:MAG TPA: MFS transporter, partial [Acidimicrobiales bacterium]|nr:MFS transporter [Acidimicrobiales bacterium]
MALPTSPPTPRRVRRAASWTGRRVERSLGGAARTRVVVLLAAVLALSSADVATVGASATQLVRARHISNTDVGLLVTVSSLIGAVASVPFGVVADRFNRTRTLTVAVALWGVAMLWSATARDFRSLLEARVALGFVTAAAGPIPASLIGDYFPADERGRIYGYLLSGELLGAGIGFSVTGDIAALS